MESGNVEISYAASECENLLKVIIIIYYLYIYAFDFQRRLLGIKYLIAFFWVSNSRGEIKIILSGTITVIIKAPKDTSMD